MLDKDISIVDEDIDIRVGGRGWLRLVGGNDDGARVVDEVVLGDGGCEEAAVPALRLRCPAVGFRDAGPDAGHFVRSRRHPATIPSSLPSTAPLEGTRRNPSSMRISGKARSGMRRPANFQAGSDRALGPFTVNQTHSAHLRLG